MKREELVIEAKPLIETFVKNKIESGKLNISYGDHGHLGYQDDKFWGHYIFPTKTGVEVTVYLQQQIKGDPMDMGGSRGPSFNVDIVLNKSLREKLLTKLEGDLPSFKDDYEASSK